MEGGAVADACKSLASGGEIDPETACACMSSFEQPPPDCMMELSGANPFEGWEKCRGMMGNSFLVKQSSKD